MGFLNGVPKRSSREWDSLTGSRKWDSLTGKSAKVLLLRSGSNLNLISTAYINSPLGTYEQVNICRVRIYETQSDGTITDVIVVRHKTKDIHFEFLLGLKSIADNYFFIHPIKEPSSKIDYESSIKEKDALSPLEYIHSTKFYSSLDPKIKNDIIEMLVVYNDVTATSTDELTPIKLNHYHIELIKNAKPFKNIPLNKNKIFIGKSLFPIDVKGEIFISGFGVENREIEFFGRIDFQNEIESCMKEIEGIEYSIVLDKIKENHNKYLVIILVKRNWNLKIIKPETEIENILSKIYANLFTINPNEIGKPVDFFELGNDSFNAITLSKENLISLVINKNINNEEFPVTSQQLGLYLDSIKNPNSLIYNKIINLNKLKDSIHSLFEKHEILKTKYIEKEFDRKLKIVGVVDRSCKLQFEKYTKEKAKSFVRPFDISVTPLIRVGFIDDEILMMNLHHY
ncbi:hypothetical protein H8356DRAFT_1354331 [Neocallimastix lanati (nom. inval.)]|nr:hypothetical protein H8356DRAFT_1354331 [Neocallimastix sp. JGI-2020a]